jgi:hypothetical protein
MFALLRSGLAARVALTGVLREKLESLLKGIWLASNLSFASKDVTVLGCFLNGTIYTLYMETFGLNCGDFRIYLSWINENTQSTYVRVNKNFWRELNSLMSLHYLTISQKVHKCMTLHKTEEFYTEWFWVCYNITSKCCTIVMPKRRVMQNND